MRVLLAVVAVLVLSGCAKTSAELVDYRVGPGENEITVTYLQGPEDSAGRVEIAVEDRTHVELKVLYRAAAGPQDDVAVFQQAVVRLAEPVGTRRIYDERGNPLSRR